jgi:hypothetical protein
MDSRHTCVYHKTLQKVAQSHMLWVCLLVGEEKVEVSEIAGAHIDEMTIPSVSSSVCCADLQLLSQQQRTLNAGLLAAS